MGIPLGPADFTRGAAKPLDDTFLKADQAARNAIVAGVRYLGLQVHVIADSQTYELKGGILDANWSPIGGGGTTPLPVVDSFTGNGAIVAFTLTATPGTKENIIVFIDGLRQSTADYSVSGTTLTFSTAPGNLRAIQTITGSVSTVNVPAANSVLTTSILDGAVTQAKKQIRAIHATAAVAGGILKTGSSGGYSRQDTTEQDITNLTGSLVVLGNPVQLELIGDGTGIASIGVRCSSPGFPKGEILIYRNSVYIDAIDIAMGIPTGASSLTLPPSAFRFTDYPGAGTHTYTLRASTGSTSTTALDVIRCKLQVYEI